MSLREQNGEQKKEIEILREQISKFEKDMDTANDPELYRKYKESQTMCDDLASQLASKNFNITEKAKDTSLIMEQYESMKKSQLELVEMNKKLIRSHEEEIKSLTEYITKTDKDLTVKTKKLEKYQDIIKSFNGQIEMFEEFQKNSVREIEKLQDQASLFQDLYKKEKLEKEELIKKLRPSMRPLPENLKQENLLSTRKLDEALNIRDMDDDQQEGNREDTLLETNLMS